MVVSFCLAFVLFCLLFAFDWIGCFVVCLFGLVAFFICFLGGYPLVGSIAGVCFGLVWFDC